MKSFNYVITDEVGIHARPAGLLVKEAKKYESAVTIVKGRCKKAYDVNVSRRKVRRGDHSRG